MIDGPDESSAVSISDFLLDVTGAAYMARDFDAFSVWFHLPQIVGTFEGDRNLETRDDLRMIFDAMCAQFDAMGVLELHRETLEAQFLDPDTVQSTYRAQQVMRGHVYGPETIAHGLLGRRDGQWRILESRYATSDAAIARALRHGHRT